MNNRRIAVGSEWVLLLFLFGCMGSTTSPIDKELATSQPKSDWQKNPVDSFFDADTARAAIRVWHSAKDPDYVLETIEVFPVPNSPNYCLAICDHQPRWWGFFGVYGLQEGHVVWQAGCEVQPTEQSVRWVRGLNLSGFTQPIIEVYGQTHMGNGNLYLYELRDQTLVLLLQTRAVDSHWGDGETFRNGRLHAEYTDLNGDGIADLILTGELEERSDFGEVVAAKHLCKKVFLWNISTGMFEEDRSRRVGLDDTRD